VTPPRSTTTYAVLGLLTLRDWTTYELAKQVQRSLQWFWPRAERKLYDEPKRLVADGLATASAEATGKRPKTVYSITPAGRSALASWLDEPSARRSMEFEALVKVFFADGGTLDQLQATLDRIIAESEERVERLGDIVASGPMFPGRAHIIALCVRLQVEEELAVLRWARWARSAVAAWSAADDPGAWDSHAVMESLVAECRAATS
jgi:PadR family transcriptional regulator, regulatory protein AphA